MEIRGKVSERVRVSLGERERNRKREKGRKRERKLSIIKPIDKPS